MAEPRTWAVGSSGSSTLEGRRWEVVWYSDSQEAHNHSPSGIEFNGGSRQKRWKPLSQPSQSSIAPPWSVLPQTSHGSSSPSSSLEPSSVLAAGEVEDLAGAMVEDLAGASVAAEDDDGPAPSSVCGGDHLRRTAGGRATSPHMGGKRTIRIDALACKMACIRDRALQCRLIQTKIIGDARLVIIDLVACA